MPDSKLQVAMAKIKAILKEADIAGCVMLVSETHGEHLYRFDPSWSIVSFDEGTGELRMKAKRADYPSQEAQMDAITKSTHMLQCFDQLAGTVHSNMAMIISMLRKSVEIERGPKPERPNPHN